MVFGKKKTQSMKEAPLTKKRIVIDARFWSESGIGRYLRNLVRELQLLDIKNDYFILLLKKDYNKVKLNSNFQKVLADFSWYGVDEQVKLPQILGQLKPDLVHFPHFNVPIFYRGKFVVTIHDLIHRHFQMRRATTHNPLFYKIKTLGYDRAFQTAARKSLGIITPSDFIKEQLIDELGVKKEKIMVTPEAVDENFAKLAREVSKKDFQLLVKKFKISGLYLFYVGNAHPHKNLPNLIAAFVRLRAKYPKLQLVLSGPDHYFWRQLKKDKVSGLVFTGFVSEKELAVLYKNAQAFVFPSLEEGFGIPVLEAMACGCPVISSNYASLPEVGGEAAIYFDPRNIQDMMEKIEQVLNSSELKKKLKENGLKRSKQFNWKTLAEQTLEVYNSALS
jgi:glycosyltransferase involved in cell wall biosynthesis